MRLTPIALILSVGFTNLVAFAANVSNQGTQDSATIEGAIELRLHTIGREHAHVEAIHIQRTGKDESIVRAEIFNADRDETATSVEYFLLKNLAAKDSPAKRYVVSPVIPVQGASR